jgi:hypothetical protein
LKVRSHWLFWWEIIQDIVINFTEIERWVVAIEEVIRGCLIITGNNQILDKTIFLKRLNWIWKENLLIL